MKLSKIALATTLLFAIAGPAAALTSPAEIAAEVQSAISAGNVHVTVEDGDVTLFGWVEDAQGKYAAELAALSLDGVDKVYNRIIESN